MRIYAFHRLITLFSRGSQAGPSHTEVSRINNQERTQPELDPQLVRELAQVREELQRAKDTNRRLREELRDSADQRNALAISVSLASGSYLSSLTDSRLRRYQRRTKLASGQGCRWRGAISYISYEMYSCTTRDFVFAFKAETSTMPIRRI